jgi:hypothetical protein
MNLNLIFNEHYSISENYGVSWLYEIYKFNGIKRDKNEAYYSFLSLIDNHEQGFEIDKFISGEYVIQLIPDIKADIKYIPNKVHELDYKYVPDVSEADSKYVPNKADSK